MKDSFKNTFPLGVQTGSTNKNWWKLKANGFHLLENQSPLAGKRSSFKNCFHVDVVTVFNSSKKATVKNIVSFRQKIGFH